MTQIKNNPAEMTANREIVHPSILIWSGEFPGGPADQMTTIENATKGAQQGWTMTLDQLAAFCSG